MISRCGLEPGQHVGNMIQLLQVASCLAVESLHWGLQLHSPRPGNSTYYLLTTTMPRLVYHVYGVLLVGSAIDPNRAALYPANRPGSWAGRGEKTRKPQTN